MILVINNRSINFYLYIAIMCLCCSCEIIDNNCGYNQENILAYNTQGIKITFQKDSSMIDKYWLEEPFNFISDTLPLYNRSCAISPINATLSKYPQKMLKKYIKKLYVLKNIECFNVSYGATNDPYKKYLYITFKISYNQADIEEMIHHELCHIYYSDYSLNNPEADIDLRIKWSELSGGHLQKDGHVAIKDNTASTEFDESLMIRGFINQYSMTNMSEDLAEITAHLFLGSKELWEYGKKYPKIQKKIDYAIGFMQENIDTTFTEMYFKKLRK